MIVERPVIGREVDHHPVTGNARRGPRGVPPMPVLADLLGLAERGCHGPAAVLADQSSMKPVGMQDVWLWPRPGWRWVAGSWPLPMRRCRCAVTEAPLPKRRWCRRRTTSSWWFQQHTVPW